MDVSFRSIPSEELHCHCRCSLRGTDQSRNGTLRETVLARAPRRVTFTAPDCHLVLVNI